VFKCQLFLVEIVAAGCKRKAMNRVPHGSAHEERSAAEPHRCRSKPGVGIGKASRAIDRGVSVRENSFQKVEAALRSLGYQPNDAAHILKGGRTAVGRWCARASAESAGHVANAG
jgi:hypothetical protein